MGLFGIGKKEKDPVCGMAVDPKSAAGRLEHEGKTYFFCSASCEHQFRAGPERYV
jgi:P-type Cu+ transporter